MVGHGLPSFNSELITHFTSNPKKMRLPYTYYIARYPVTNAQYALFVKETGHRPPLHWEGSEPPLQLRNHPVVVVSWHDAMAYCRWLTEKLREWEGTPEPLRTLLLEKGYVVRLPTEAEWEKAARGGLTLPNGKRNPFPERKWPWEGDFDPEKANTSETGIGHTTAVGCFPGGASPYEVMDMAGNVWEWCQSLYADYPYRPDDGREGLEAKGVRSLRGGSWLNGRDNARCASRDRPDPYLRDDYIGFRVVV